MKSRRFALGAAIALGVAAGLASASSAPVSTTYKSLADIQWGPGSPALPPGAQMAVLAGDPAQKGFVSIRAKFPAGYKVPPHFHPTDEHVTILSGSLMYGMGDKIDEKAATTVNPGGYFIAGARMHHYAMTKTGAVVQIDLEGPFEITYLNPADDPRKTP